MTKQGLMGDTLERQRTPNRGFAYVMSLLVALLVAGIATTLAVVSATESQISANYEENRISYYLAEAGLQHALWQLSIDPGDTTSIIGQTLASGTYDAIIWDPGDSLVQIASRGQTTSEDGTGISVQASVFPQMLNYAAVNLDDKSHLAVIEGAIGGGAIPEITVDWDALRAEADLYFAGDKTFTTDIYFEGVIYAAGDLKFEGNQVWILGTLVAEHDIEFKTTSRVCVIAGPGMPALMADHDILLGRDGQFCNIYVRGLAYAAGHLNLRKYNQLTGTGTFAGKSVFEIHGDCTSITITWDPDLRLRRPLGISQNGGNYAWVYVPGTWELLSDLTVIETYLNGGG